MILILVILGLAVWGFVQQVIVGIPFGNNPAPDQILILLLLTPFLIFGFFLSLTLHTRIDQHGITYRFAPIHRKDRLIKWESVKRAEVRKYKPIAEYGGWGFRQGRSGSALNIAGNIGLQLELSDGKKILIGTQKSDELKIALQKLGKFQALN